MAAAISASQVRYIKLGQHGDWEDECLKSGTIRMGFGTQKPSRFRLCQLRKWDKLRKSFLDAENSQGKATEFTNQVRLLFEDDGTTLWITFRGNRMYWGFLDRSSPERHADGVGIWRIVANGWQCKDMKGVALTKNRLSRDVAKLAGYPGTSCEVHAANYVIRRINRGASDQVSQEVDDSMVEALEEIQARSQGFLLDSKLRKALEDYAMEAAKRHFAALKYKCDDHSKTCPYDLHCSQDHEVLYVEVKGTQSDGGEIILTPGEVKFARNRQKQMCLFVLHSIRVSEEKDGFVLSGGKHRLILPWDVNLGMLKPVSFKYELPSSGGD